MGKNIFKMFSYLYKNLRPKHLPLRDAIPMDTVLTNVAQKDKVM